MSLVSKQKKKYSNYFEIVSNKLRKISFSSNALIDFMLNGTAVKEALENGKNLDADACEKIYSSCPLDKQQSLQILSKLLPGANAASN